jgi:hypothetical protein
MGTIKKLALLGIALQLTGCAVLGPKDESAEFLKSYRYDKSKSYALNVMQAARLDDGLYDMRRPKDFDSVGPDNGLGSEIVESALTAAAWSGLSAVGKGVFLGSIGKTRRKSDFLHTFGWTPKVKAATPSEAKTLFLENLIEGAKPYFINKGYTVTKEKQSGGNSEIINVGLESNQCDVCPEEGECHRCSIDVIYYHKWGKQVPAKTPAFLGSEDAFFSYTTHPTIAYAVLYSNEKTMKSNTSYFDVYKENRSESRVERYLEYSKSLPKWVFLYLPQRWDRKNILDYPNLPILINQGKIHYFFTPEKN